MPPNPHPHLPTLVVIPVVIAEIPAKRPFLCLEEKDNSLRYIMFRTDAKVWVYDGGEIV